MISIQQLEFTLHGQREVVVHGEGGEAHRKAMHAPKSLWTLVWTQCVGLS